MKRIPDEQKLTLLLKVLKQYAEQKHCYDEYGDDYNPDAYTHGEDAFEDGAEYGEILFARTLLEQIGVEWKFSDPCPKCGTELESASGGGVKCPNKDCDYWFCY